MYVQKCIGRGVSEWGVWGVVVNVGGVGQYVF